MRGFSPVVLANKRKNSKILTMPPAPDVTFIYAEDVLEWDTYLSRQFEGSGTIIQHEQVEKMTFPIHCSRTSIFSDARVVLVILSPALVNFLDTRASEGFQFTKLLKPSKTIAMLCGVTPSGLSGIKDVLVSYDDWHHLEAKDKDINMVRQCIELMQEMLATSKENERINKPKFKLIPRKVQEGNGKVYVMLTKPLDCNASLRITLEANGAREVPVKKRNPYTLVFIIPDDMMQVQNIVNVHVWCGEDLLGVSPIKCVSKMGELYSLLTSVTSPYELLCDTLGMAALYDVDSHLTSAFKENSPKCGFDLLHKDVRIDKIKKTKEEFPTLLHFASRYGLYQLVKELLHCPSARLAISLKNVRGLTPVQLANHAGHNEVVATIDEFLKSSNGQRKFSIESIVVPPPSSTDHELKCSSPTDYYDIPAHPVPVLHLPVSRAVGSDSLDRETDYMKMKGSYKENIQPHTFMDMNEKHDASDAMFKPCASADKKLSLLESQSKLIDIMEAYKKGASLTEVERMHNEWKILYQVSDLEAKSTLDGLRSLYAKAQKAKLTKKHSSSFSELRHFLNNKLRRKESIGSTKGNISRKHSKDLSTEKICSEPETIRPVSTLSVLSNTSSSSGSSFDRLSTASAGSDSGHHSDFGDDRNNKLKDRFESRYSMHKKTLNTSSNTMNLQKNIQCLNLSSKPPAPPPRPVKPVSRYGSLEDCKQTEIPQYAISKKNMIPPSFEETFKLMDYIQPDCKSSTLSNDFRVRKSSVSATEFPFDDPNANYDCPPPPRPNCSALKSSKNSSLPIPLSPKTDYDLVPPPLPVSSPPRKYDVPISIFDQDQSYDIPNSMPINQSFQRSNSVTSNYDFPKTTLMDNTDTQAACTCQVAPNKNNLSSVKSCCVGSKLSSLKPMNNLPSVPNSDVIFNIEREKDVKSVNDSRPVRNQYYNVCIMSPKKVEICQRDSIPEEFAPPPPILDHESPEEHYKMVGAPIPVSPISNMS